MHAPDRAKLSLLVADDHPMFRLGMKLALEEAGFGYVEAVADGESAMARLERRSFDVVILDVKMPGRNGLEVASAALRSGPGALGAPRPCVIVMSTFDQPAVVRKADELGVAACIGKETPPETLALLIDRLVGGTGQPLAAVRRGGRVLALTDREQDVLHLLCTGATTKQIASSIGLSPDTVKDYLSNLYAKLGARDRAGAVHAAHQLGWIVLDDLLNET